MHLVESQLSSSSGSNVPHTEMPCPADSQYEPIAITGIGCRLPGRISNTSQLWDFLEQKRSAVGKVPESRFNIDSWTGEAGQTGTAKGIGGYFLQEDIRHFDNNFFGINNREASDMDPQQRKLLEVVFESFENAGVSLDEVSGANIGCFVASFTPDFLAMQSRDAESMTRYTQTGMGTTILANRISHVFNMKGPSCVLDTACSSSLYALHTACSALLAGECDSAVVAGVNLIQTPELHVSISQAGVTSSTSTCHTFDSSADGYGRADGINAVYIKRLDAAVRDGDTVRSIIRATAVNSNGRTPGITLPSIDGQEAVIRKAYARANLSPVDTFYVETHGTGTAVGDPIEVEALSRVFEKTKRKHPTMLGSVKTNLGHSEAASGLTSIIKATVALEKGQIPATIGVRNLNPKIKTEDWGVNIVKDTTPFPDRSTANRRISVNSFGYGGANAHCILEEARLTKNDASMLANPSNGYQNGHANGHTNGCANEYVNGHGDGSTGEYQGGPVNGHSDRGFGAYSGGSFDNTSEHINGSASGNNVPPDRSYILPFSANSQQSLSARIQGMAGADFSSISVADLAHTLGNRRSHLSARGYIIAKESTLKEDLNVENLYSSKIAMDLTSSKFVFCFTGQGAQWPGMARELMQFSIFRDTIRQLDKELSTLPHGPVWRISDILMDVSNTSPINKARYAQPMTTAVQIGLVNLLRAWSIAPSGTVGHSSGEIGAAYASGMLTGREAIFIAYYRGKVVTEATSEGTMAAVGLGAEITKEWIMKLGLSETVKVACINSPESVTISGDADGVDTIYLAMQSESIFIRKLKTDGRAYHSHHMAAVGNHYERLLEEAWALGFEPRNKDEPRQANMFSTVINQEITEKHVRTPWYWRKNLESPVRFLEGVKGIANVHGQDITFVEIGPHAALKMPIAQILGKETPYLASLYRGKDSAIALLRLIGDLYNGGYPVDFSKPLRALQQAMEPKVLPDLPTYPWHYEKPMLSESRFSRENRQRRHPRHELLGSEVPGGNKATYSWRNVLRMQNVPWLRDHKLGEEAVFPGAGYMAMAIEALMQVQQFDVSTHSAAVVLRSIVLLNALPLTDEDSVELYTEIRPLALSNVTTSKTWWDFQISSIADDVATIRAKGSIRFDIHESEAELPWSPDFRLEAQSKRLWYEGITKSGLAYGPTFQLMDEIYTPDSKGSLYTEARTKTLSPVIEVTQTSPRYLIHPTLLDSLFQIGLIACTGGYINSLVAKVPTKVGQARIMLPSTPKSAGTIQCISKRIGASAHRLNTYLVDDQQRMIAHFQDADITTYVGSEKMEMRHPLFRLNWKPDVDKITDNAAFEAAVNRILSFTDLKHLRSRSHLLAALDLITHKNPDTQILCLSADHVLVATALLEVLEARTHHRRFHTFSLGRFTSNGELEVADVHNFDAPFGFKALTYVRAPHDRRYGLVLLPEDSTALEKLEKRVSDDTLCLRSVSTKLDDEASIDNFSIVSITTPNSRKIQLIRPKTPSNGGISSYQNVIHICEALPSPIDAQIKEELGGRLSVSIEQMSLGDIASSSIPEDALVVSTVELKSVVFAQADEKEFDGIKEVIEKASRIVWVTGSGVHKGCDPTMSLFPGLARAIMIEQPSTKIFTLELDPQTEAHMICRDVEAILDQSRSSVADFEYIKDDCGLMISRAVPDEPMNDQFRQRQNSIATLMPLGEAGDASLSLRKPGQLSTVQFVQKSRCETQHVAPGNVVVKLRYLGLNAKDVYALAGRVQTTEGTTSAEYTGHIVAVGSGVEGLHVGDKVAVAYPGHFSTYETVPQWACVKLNDGEDMQTLSSVLIVFLTAIYALEHRARLQAGETILIHSAAGGVGIATIQLAKLLGAEVYATVGTEDKKQFLMDNYGLEADRIFNSRDASFASALMKATKGQGVDVILNTLVGDLLHESWQCLADFGRFVEIGKRELMDGGLLNMEKFGRGTTFTSFDLALFTESTSEKVQQHFHSSMERVMSLLRDGQVEPVKPLPVFNISDVRNAFNHFNSAKRMGKIIISLDDQTQRVPVVRQKYLTQLSPEKSYLLVGCLGGLGRSLSKWMLSRGARKFVFIGRTGTEKPAAKRLIEDLETAGAHCVVIKGNVTSYDDVASAIQAAPSPLGGVVQAAMGLNEAIFKYMPQEYWISGTEAKVKGTWNLHNALSEFNKEKDLDFFIMTSSISGKVGTATESNYCAANNFLDVFARYRRSLGLTATSLGLGMISEVGYLHENPHIEDLLLRKGVRPITESELLQFFDFGLSTPSTSVHPENLLSSSHLLTGLEVTGLQDNHKQGYSGYWQFLDDARFSVLTYALKRSSTSELTQGTTHSSLISEAVAAKDEEGLSDAVRDVLSKKMSNLILLPIEKMDVNVALSDFGMDSMLAAELRQFIFSTTGADILFLTLMDKKTSLSTLATTISAKLLGDQ